MKTFLVTMAMGLALFTYDARSQCGMTGLIGEFNEWNNDLFLNRDPIVPEEFSLFLFLTASDDINGDGIIELKFRENSDWDYTWGNAEFPGGTAILNGPNIPVPIGNYFVTYNCTNHAYYFETTCGRISMIGEFNGWAEDQWMTRNANNPDEWYADLSLNPGDDIVNDGVIEMKFRMNSDWSFNWGSTEFPSGTGIPYGPNIPVPLTFTGLTTDYRVSFNCVSGEYDFVETSGPISLSGEFNNFTGDHLMERDAENPDQYSTILTLLSTDDSNGDGIIEMKFRENADWTLNWGSGQFPSGTATEDGPYIQVPLDATGTTTDYFVTFNYSTLEFSFQSTSGAISIIGAFIGWIGDIPMNRVPESPDNWTLIRSWYEDSEVKFRENQDWSVNWGNSSWPSGTGELNGQNIPLVAGTYEVSFNASTGAYNFADNPDVCGEIGMVGDFNEWGGTGESPTDVFLLRDPVYPDRFSLDYSFQSSTNLLFRMNADPDFTDVWGGTTLCQTGVKDSALLIPLVGGTYHITFDCNSGDYCLTPVVYSTVAPKVIAMAIDGEPDESSWDISLHATKIVGGSSSTNLNAVNFGVTYNDLYLYVGVDVTDSFVNEGDAVQIFVDGDYSAGNYDEHDVDFRINGSGDVEVITGPPGGIIINANIKIKADGYSVEAAIPWAALDTIPVEGGNAGFDLIVWDDDLGWQEYGLAWNGTIDDYNTTATFGKVEFGSLQCGCLSIFNPEIGDILLRPLDNSPLTYVATYDFDADFGVVFRQDKASFVTWGSLYFPFGTAGLGGPEIPATTGRYRVTFNCKWGDFNFEEAPLGSNVTFADFTENAPVIDGQLDEYDLLYHSNIISIGAGPVNNTVNWGSRWDVENLYVGVQVIDEALLGNGSPWDNDAIEFYIDGNNDKDGPYDPDFDTHIIMDVLNQSVPWFKADGVPVTNYNAQFTNTALGFNVEMRLGWNNFGFEPGKGRVMGWSLANDDNDNNLGRDYQTVWYGTANNWNNTTDLGDLQLANGPYTHIPEIPGREDVLIYPNPTGGEFSILFPENISKANFHIEVFDVSGRMILTELNTRNNRDNVLSLNLQQSIPGLYLVHIYSDEGNYFVKKLVVQR